MSTKPQWLAWLALTSVMVAFFVYSLLGRSSSASRTFLPGVTTHGHYQIELRCQECHTPGMGVLHDACTRCHGQELKEATDTHPRSKFTDPGKAHMVAKLDGRSCVTCHQEHVPDRTLAMGLSLPGDYCWHCHQDVGEQRPSHRGLAYDSCAASGCHNYHDNRALFEDFLVNHFGEPDVLDDPRVPARGGASTRNRDDAELQPLAAADQDSPLADPIDRSVLDEWSADAHAAAGVNCSGCHVSDAGVWSDRLSHDACQRCHDREVGGFLAGRHGMRLAVDLPALSPGMARLPMKHDALHRDLDCTTCHQDHRFDVRFAAVDACLGCHNDAHSLAYKESAHFALWEQELNDPDAAGAGVSCATCHMPRLKGPSGEVFVQHNQNDNLRPNDKMVRSACDNCHGLQFTLDALADRPLIDANFKGLPSTRVESIDMAKAWADERERLREERARRRAQSKQAAADTQRSGG